MPAFSQRIRPLILHRCLCVLRACVIHHLQSQRTSYYSLEDAEAKICCGFMPWLTDYYLRLIYYTFPCIINMSIIKDIGGNNCRQDCKIVFITQFPGFRWPELCETSAFLGEISQTWLTSKDDNLILEVLQIHLAIFLRERKVQKEIFVFKVIFEMLPWEDGDHVIL